MKFFVSFKKPFDQSLRHFVRTLCPMRHALCCANAMNKFLPIIFVLVILFLPATSDAKREHPIEGRTMGTTYHIKVISGVSGGVNGLKEKIDARLDAINQVFSTYIKDSEISALMA